MIEMHIETEVLDAWVAQLHRWYGHNWTSEDMLTGYLCIHDDAKQDAVDEHVATGSGMDEETYICKYLESHHNWAWGADENSVPYTRWDGSQEREMMQAKLCDLAEAGHIENPVISADCVWGKIALSRGRSWG